MTKKDLPMLYSCAPTIGFKGDNNYACESMGIFDNLKESVECINNLHNSFGYCIYPISSKITKNITVYGGMAGQRVRDGNLIVGDAIHSFSTEFHVSKNFL